MYGALLNTANFSDAFIMTGALLEAVLDRSTLGVPLIASAD